MMTSAALLGIDSCPIEGFDLDKVTEILSDEGVFRYGTIWYFSYGRLWLQSTRT